MDEINTQVVVIEQPAMYEDRPTMRYSFFNPDGTPFDFSQFFPETILAGDILLTDIDLEVAAAAIEETDTTLEAFAKLQAQNDAALTTATTATAIGTAAKVVTTAEPDDNTVVMIKFTNGNNVASPTVAFDGGAARSIYLGGIAPTAAEAAVAANGVVACFFDGTILHMLGAQDVTASKILLTGLAVGDNTPILATDSILVAFANLQAQIDAL